MARTVRVALEGILPGEHAISGAPAHYLTRVLRLREGSSFTAFDPVARIEAEATLVALGGGEVRARFAEPVAARVVGLVGVTLVQCAGKGDKVDDVVRAATALGASRIVIALGERSVARGAPSDERSARLRAIALDAARQSGRGDLPEVAGPLPLPDVLRELAEQSALKLCLDPGGTTTLGAALAERAERELVLLIGPEGGFSPTEREQAESTGFVRVRFGNLVLRTELAASAALGAVVAQVP